MNESDVYISAETLKILKQNLYPWVMAAALSDLPMHMAVERYSPHRTERINSAFGTMCRDFKRTIDSLFDNNSI